MNFASSFSSLCMASSRDWWPFLIAIINALFSSCMLLHAWCMQASDVSISFFYLFFFFCSFQNVTLTTTQKRKFFIGAKLAYSFPFFKPISCHFILGLSKVVSDQKLVIQTLFKESKIFFRFFFFVCACIFMICSYMLHVHSRQGSTTNKYIYRREEFGLHDGCCIRSPLTRETLVLCCWWSPTCMRLIN